MLWPLVVLFFLAVNFTATSGEFSSSSAAKGLLDDLATVEANSEGKYSTMLADSRENSVAQFNTSHTLQEEPNTEEDSMDSSSLPRSRRSNDIKRQRRRLLRKCRQLKEEAEASVEKRTKRKQRKKHQNRRPLRMLRSGDEQSSAGTSSSDAGTPGNQEGSTSSDSISANVPLTTSRTSWPSCRADIYASNFEARTICPFEWTDDVDHNRIPSVIPVAKCNCDESCHGVSGDSTCSPVMVTLKVRENGTDVDRDFSMACVCVLSHAGSDPPVTVTRPD